MDVIFESKFMAADEYILVTSSNLLPNRLASLVSSVSSYSRTSIQLSLNCVDSLADSLKQSTIASLDFSRKLLVSAVSSISHPASDNLESQAYADTFDSISGKSVDLIHNAFSLAELFTLASFNLTCSTIKFSLQAAQECVDIFDGLFGETDTSKALAAMIILFAKEWQDHPLGQLYGLGQITKATTAFCCLQLLNRNHWKPLIVLHSVFEDFIESDGYDPSSVHNVFTTVSIKKNVHVPSMKQVATIPMSALPALGPVRRRANSSPLDDTFTHNPLPFTPRKFHHSHKYHVRQAARFVDFAVGVYGSHFLTMLGINKKMDPKVENGNHHPNHKTLAAYTNIPLENVITSSFDPKNPLFSSKLLAPAHFLVVDNNAKTIILSLRGTLGLSDLITDIKANYEEFEFEDCMGQVHSGMLQSSRMISDKVLPLVLQALKDFEGYQLVLTGHSLGGGCAALLALMWSEKRHAGDGTTRYYAKTSAEFPQDTKIHCYVYGCPAVMSADLSKACIELVSTFVFRNDIVARLSMGLVSDFRNVTINISEEDGIAETVIGKALGIFKEPEGEIKDDLWYWALFKTLRADMKAEKLYPPGKVFWINSPITTTKTTMPHHVHVRVDLVDDVETAFSEIAFSTTMFSDHSPHHYQGSLKMLITKI